MATVAGMVADSMGLTTVTLGYHPPTMLPHCLISDTAIVSLLVTVGAVGMGIDPIGEGDGVDMDLADIADIAGAGMAGADSIGVIGDAGK